LNASNRGTERNVLSHLDESDPEIAQEVRELLFVFEDVLKLDDRSIQIVLKEVDTRDIALALRGSTDQMRDRIMGNMSKRGAEMLKEDMEYMPPQRKTVVEQAQSKIVEVVRRLDETNVIQIVRGEEESEALL
jgi:flagellar motor switch protein FliG